MGTTKTTFYLSDSLRTRLKTAAARGGKTMSELLVEGAEIVIARYQGAQDRQQLQRAAREAELALRRGLYSGPSKSAEVDDLVYGQPARRRRHR